MKKYNDAFLTTHATHCAILAIPAALIVLVITLIFKIFPNDVLLTLVPIALGILAFLWGFVKCAAFEASAKSYSVPFDDKNSKPLFRGSTVFLSDNWLICAGQFAAPREEIKKISLGVSNSDAGKNFSFGVVLENGRVYNVSVDSQASARKVITWLNKNDEAPRKKK